MYEDTPKGQTYIINGEITTNYPRLEMATHHQGQIHFNLII